MPVHLTPQAPLRALLRYLSINFLFLGLFTSLDFSVYSFGCVLCIFNACIQGRFESTVHRMTLPLQAAFVIYNEGCWNPTGRVPLADRTYALGRLALRCRFPVPVAVVRTGQRAKRETKCCRRTSTVDSDRVGELSLSFCYERLDCAFIFFRDTNQLHTSRLVLVHVELVEMRNRDFAWRAPGCPELNHRHLASADLKGVALHKLKGRQGCCCTPNFLRCEHCDDTTRPPAIHWSAESLMRQQAEGMNSPYTEVRESS